MIGGLIAILGRRFVEIIKLKAYAIAFYAAAAVSLLFAFVFALVSLRHWIVVTFAANYPDLWIATGFFVIAAAMVGLAVYIQRKEAPSSPAADLALLAGPPVAKFAIRRLSPGAIAVGIVLIAGLVVGRRMTQRST
jgi:hypothetical protein